MRLRARRRGRNRTLVVGPVRRPTANVVLLLDSRDFGAALAAAALLGAVAAGCGGGEHMSQAAESVCVLSPKQERAVAAAERDIRRLRRIEAPLTTWSEKGTPALQEGTNTVLLDIGRGELPINTRARLIRLAKSEVGLCGLCFGALEAEEPAVAGRQGHECGGGR